MGEQSPRNKEGNHFYNSAGMAGDCECEHSFPGNIRLSPQLFILQVQ